MRHIRVKEFFRILYQKKPVQWIVSVFIVLFFPIIGLYAHVIEPRLVKISHLKIPIRKLPRSFNLFRIVQISDLHFGPTNDSVSFLKKCIDKINNLKPDIVALTGDFLQWDSKYIRPLAQLLSGLKAKNGLFAVLGNHDYGVCHKGHPPTDPIDHEEVIHHFEKRGIRVLHNERVKMQKGNDCLEVIGVGDYWTPHFQPDKLLTREAVPTILLCHNPDGLSKMENLHFDLMLSGHVHGGQISFPFIGPLAVPVERRHLRRGLHRLSQKWLYVNRGLGYIFKARLLSRPEITCLDLVNQPAPLAESPPSHLPQTP
ncbi:MAG: metallophosphoesterase [Deltaproteobacteria bacterium]|nr:metallophosphoesterase [Deltaproteobacteria bacterium]